MVVRAIGIVVWQLACSTPLHGPGMGEGKVAIQPNERGGRTLWVRILQVELIEACTSVQASSIHVVPGHVRAAPGRSAVQRHKVSLILHAALRPGAGAGSGGRRVGAERGWSLSQKAAS
jgi:hypothetical protein